MTRFEKWQGLLPGERRLLVLLALLLPLADVLIRLLGALRSVRMLGCFRPKTPVTHQLPQFSEIEYAHRLAWLTGVAARHGLYRGTCLRQSLVLWWLLRRCGLPVELHIGSTLTAGRMDAHAWVTLGADVLNDSADVSTRYAHLAVTPTIR